MHDSVAEGRHRVNARFMDNCASSRAPSVGPLRRSLGRAFLRAFGWSTHGAPPVVPKAVFVAAPHTSNWDLPFTLATAWAMGVNVSWVGKRSLFRFPLGPIMRALGGIPVDRARGTSFVRRTA